MAQHWDLAPYAVRADQSRGRAHAEPVPSLRNEFQRDRDRIVHSAAFRRLEYKTQVFVNHEGDMFRTRLTHSMEVTQIARTVARVLHLNEDLTEAIALAHDLGHTPFGHAGQDALNEAMADHGGFEHNLQSLRVVDRLEEKYAEFAGLNLTYETREGILKHCSKAGARELGELGRRFIERKQASLEAQLADVADSIAYNNHDVDDGLRAGLIDIGQLAELAVFHEPHAEVTRRWPSLQPRRVIHEVIRRVINCQILDLVNTTRAAIADVSPANVEEVREAGATLVGFSEEIAARNLELKRFLHEQVYRHYRVQRMTRKAGRIVKQLFDAFLEDPAMLPPDARQRMDQAADTPSSRARAVADYIAGMTDRFAIAEYERVFQPGELT